MFENTEFNVKKDASEQRANSAIIIIMFIEVC